MHTLFAAWAGLAGLGAGLGATERRDPRVRGRLAAMSAPVRGGDTEGATSRVVLAVSRMRLCDAPRVRRRLLLAGVDADFDRHVRRKLRWGAIGAGAGLVLGGLGVGGAILGAVLGAAGFRGPDLVLARRATARQARLAASTPDLFDLLCACVAAGLGPAAALDLAASRFAGPMGDELRRAVGRVGMGDRWSVALDELASRTEVTSVHRLRTALVQTERLGTSLDLALRDLASDARGERRATAEARARAAPVKLLFPLVFLILPAFLLLTVVPVVLATLRNLH